MGKNVHFFSYICSRKTQNVVPIGSWGLGFEPQAGHKGYSTTPVDVFLRGFIFGRRCKTKLICSRSNNGLQIVS